MTTSKKTLEEIELHKTVGLQYKVRYRFPFAAAFQQERNDIILDLLKGDGEGEGLVLDLGCGTGVMIDTLAGRFRYVMGLDASLEMMSAIDRSPRLKCEEPIQLMAGDIEILPLRNEALDFVVCRSILHHANSEDRALEEAFRVLKPGGRMVIAEPMNDNPLLRLARWIVRHGKSYGKIHTIGKAFVAPELKAAVRRAGFDLEKEVRYGFLAYPLCDNPDLVPLLKYCPFSGAVAAALRGVDRLLSRIPLVKGMSWYAIMSAHKPAGGGVSQ